MPTKIEVNLQTGEINEFELEGEELAAYEASLAAQAAKPTQDPEAIQPSLAEIVAQLQAEVAALKEKA